MARILFVTYEIHPTNRGGCGVLLHHAAELLLQQGHEVSFLLAVPEHEFRQFVEKDRLSFTNAHNCRAFHLDALCEGFTLRPEDCPSRSVHESARFAHAYAALARTETFDFVEFFEYCGVAYYALARRLFGREINADPSRPPVLGSRLHNSLELIDLVGSTRYLDRARYHLYALEHGQLNLSEAVLTPTSAYFERYYKDRYHLPVSKVVVSQSPKLPFPSVTRRPDPARDHFSIVYVGRLYQFKGVDQLVQAAVSLLTKRPTLRCTFDVIGADSSESPLGHSFKEFLLAMIPKAMQDRFEFPGNLSHEQFGQRLNSALFAVFPNRFESFCYAAHEVYDAGVPMIVRDLPGWSDFFTHEQNALVYDGRTDSLVAAMERMIDESSLREKLRRPYAIATDPLGEFYSNPRALDPLVSAAPALPQTLAVVLCDAEHTGPEATLAALAAQDHPPTRTLILRAAGTHGTNAPGAHGHGSFWWLGKLWHADSHAPHLTTLDALVILRAGDRPQPAWLKACATALAHKLSLGFSGTWATQGGHLRSSDLDLSPEAYPFEHGERSTRALIRTAPGQLLADALDPVLAGLGEVGLLWQSIAHHGPGVFLNEPLIDLAPDAPAPAEPSILKYLLTRHGHPFADRLALYAGLMHDHTQALQSQVRTLAAQANVPIPSQSGGSGGGMALDPPLEHKVRVADELGGKTLLKLAWRKIWRKATGRKPTG